MSGQWVRVRSLVRNITEKPDDQPRPFLALEDIESGTGRILPTELPFKATEDGIRHQAGDVLFSKLRPYLAKSWLARELGAATSELMVLRSGPGLDPRFLFYLSLSKPWIDWGIATSYGSKMPRTSWEAMGDFRTWLPELEDQRRIVNFLDVEAGRVDALVDAKRRMIELVGERLSAVREALLTQDVRAADVPLMRLTDPRRPIVYGIVQAGPHVPGGVPYIKSGDLPNLNPESLSRTSLETHQQYRRAAVQPGDIVLAMRASIGALAVVPEELKVANLTQGTARIAAEKCVHKKWLFHALQTRVVQEQCMVRAVGATFRTLNIWDLRRVIVPTVPPDAQECLADKMDSVNETHSAIMYRLRNQLAVLGERKKALIAAAVTGKIDVTTARSVGA